MNKTVQPHYHIKVLYSGSSPHLTQIFAGLGLLERQELLTLRYVPSLYTPINNSPTRIRVKIDEANVVFDMFDGHEIDDDDYNWANIYFKRSFSRAKHLIYPKMVAFGFNYGVFGPNDHWSERYLVDFRKLVLTKDVSVVHTFIRNNKLLARLLLQTSSNISNAFYKNFEALPNLSKNPKIIFFTRLWEPYQSRGIGFVHERTQINDMRIGIIRKLRKIFPANFIGGLEPTMYAREIAPELVVEKSIIRKKSYLDNMKNADICIATKGLLDSNGWKFGEYIAASRAIVSERLSFEVPGSFHSGENYLEFSGVSDCVDSVKQLFENPILRYKVMVNNFLYYQQYLRPDMLLLNALNQVSSET